MFRFGNIEYLYYLAVIPALIVIFIIILQIRKSTLKKFGDIDLINKLMPNVSIGRVVFKFIALLLAITAIIFGIARPQFGSKLKEVKREGVELMIALDVSNSMLAEDIQPSRLEMAKRAIAKLIDRLSDDKIGLIVFAGEAYTQLPITTDYAAAKMFLSTVGPKMVNKQGTAIGAAIKLGMKSFTSQEDKNRALIIITDGENHEDDAVQAALEAAKKGVIIYTLGMGLAKGGPIPVYNRYGQKDFRKDKSGQVVVSKLDEAMLQQIAVAGNGSYVRANNTRAGLNSLFDEINKLEKEEFEAKIYSDYDEKFQFLFGIALFFLLLEFVIITRKNKFFKNVNLFKDTNLVLKKNKE